MKKPFETTRHCVRSTKIRIPFCVVQVSDLHNALYGKNQSALLEAIAAEHPDWIAVTGDLFNRKNPGAYRNALVLIEGLERIAPVYVVEGNHEAALGKEGERLLQETVFRGATLLCDEKTTVFGVNLIGLKQRATVETLQSLTDPERFNLVLCHRPELFLNYAQTDADVILCGHAHGGQIRIGNTALYAPQQGMFPPYTSGLYERNGTKLYVSRGLGDTVIWPRIHNPHELNVFRFAPETE